MSKLSVDASQDFALPSNKEKYPSFIANNFFPSEEAKYRQAIDIYSQANPDADHQFYISDNATNIIGGKMENMKCLHAFSPAKPDMTNFYKVLDRLEANDHVEDNAEEIQAPGM